MHSCIALHWIRVNVLVIGPPVEVQEPVPTDGVDATTSAEGGVDGTAAPATTTAPKQMYRCLVMPSDQDTAVNGGLPSSSQHSSSQHSTSTTTLSQPTAYSTLDADQQLLWILKDSQGEQEGVPLDFEGELGWEAVDIEAGQLS